jgi:hypothetical protein
MSITPTATIRSASPRPYAGARGASLSVSTMSHGSFQAKAFGGHWVCCDHMSTEHNPTTGNTTGSKRPGPGSFVNALT